MSQSWILSLPLIFFSLDRNKHNRSVDNHCAVKREGGIYNKLFISSLKVSVINLLYMDGSANKNSVHKFH